MKLSAAQFISKRLALSKRSESKGFTLIELLVVIGILGILAAALVATIDPFEQLQKANDSKIKNMTVEFINANVRYYTTHNAFPWNDAASNNAACVGLGGALFTAAKLNGAEMLDCIAALIEEGELKSGFSSNVNDLAKVLVTWNPADATDVVVCFGPTSKSQKASPEAIYNNDGTAAPPATCPNANAPDGTCFWCTR